MARGSSDELEGVWRASVLEHVRGQRGEKERGGGREREEKRESGKKAKRRRRRRRRRKTEGSGTSMGDGAGESGKKRRAPRATGVGVHTIHNRIHTRAHTHTQHKHPRANTRTHARTHARTCTCSRTPSGVGEFAQHRPPVGIRHKIAAAPSPRCVCALRVRARTGVRASERATGVRIFPGATLS